MRIKKVMHGMTHSDEYSIWTGIKKRCSNPKTQFYHVYGGKGIDVCDEWKNDFNIFYRDMGPRPSAKHSIDRIDNNNGYSKTNCRWATPKEQARNTSRSKMVTINGKTQCLADWADESGINRFTLKDRVNRCWPADRLLEKPSSEKRIKRKSRIEGEKK